MWFSSKAYKALSAENRMWLDHNKHQKIGAQLTTCAVNNNVALVDYLRQTQKIYAKDLYAAAHAAIKANAHAGLTAVLKNTGFSFVHEHNKNVLDGKSLFACAAETSLEIFKTLWNVSQDTKSPQSKVKTHDIVRIGIAADDSMAMFETCINLMVQNNNCISSYRALLDSENIITNPEKLKILLAARKPDVESLSYRLFHNTHRPEVIKALMAAGANPNNDNYAAFEQAIAHKHFDTITLMLPAIKLTEYWCKKNGENLLAVMHNSGADPSLLKDINTKVNAYKQSVYTLADAHTLSCTKKLEDGTTLTTLFNFQAAQQVIIAKHKDQSIAITATDFSAFSNQEYLEEMRQKLLSLSGTAEPFSRLKKNRLSPE